MSGRPVEVATCATSLLRPGECCIDGCPVPATLAVLDTDLVEHTWCPGHAATEESEASKPLVWDPLWG